MKISSLKLADVVEFYILPEYMMILITTRNIYTFYLHALKFLVTLTSFKHLMDINNIQIQ